MNDIEPMVLGVATVVGLVLIINQLVRMRRVNILHKTIREAIARDSAMVPMLIDNIDGKQAAGNNDDRTGLVLLALAFAVFGCGLIQGDLDDIKSMAGIALFPGFVGAALLARAWYARKQGPAL